MTTTNRVRVPHHTRSRLDNGLTVFLVEDHRLPMVACHLQFAGGALDNPAGKEGLASMTARLLNQGTRRRDARSLAEAVDSLGASYSAGSGWDSTSITLAGLSEDLPTLFDILAEVTLEPTFPSDEIETMRQRRLHGLTRSLDDASLIADWTFAAHLHAGHPYAGPLSGSARSVSDLTREDLVAHRETSMTPARGVLAIAGDFDAQATLSLIESRFSDWSAGDIPPAAPLPDPPGSDGRSVVLVHRPDLTQAQIRWGHAGLAGTDPTFDAAEVMNYTLGGGGFSSRLIQRIRAELGLTYGVSSRFQRRVLAGPFTISTFTPCASVPQVLEEIDSLVGCYRDGGPTVDELSEAKSRFIGGYALGFETAVHVLGHLVDVELFGLEVGSLETYQDRVDALGCQDAAALARSTLHPEQALAVVVGNADAYESKLAAFGDVRRFDARAAFGA